MAAKIKALDRGEQVAPDPAGKIAASKEKGEFTFCVIMDDKALNITLPWAKIREMSEAELSGLILKRMLGRPGKGTMIVNY